MTTSPTLPDQLAALKIDENPAPLLEFNFDTLKTDFSRYCLDYNDNITLDKRSRACEFCDKMLFEAGPELRRHAKMGTSASFTFKFANNGTRDDPEMKDALVSNKVPENCAVLCNDGILLSERNATLLALSHLEKINELLLPLNSPVISPVAAAMFPNPVIYAIAMETGEILLDILNAINASCYSGGEFLPNSRLAIAVVAIMGRVTNERYDEKTKNAAIARTFKHYRNCNKQWDPIAFKIFAKWGRVPADISPEDYLDTDIETEVEPCGAADDKTADTSKEANVSSSPQK